MGVRTFSAAAQIGAARRCMINVNGKCVHYRIQGTGPAIVMLHDSPRSSRLHLPTMGRLADSFTVIALDTPGYGNSDPLNISDPEISDFADALYETLDTLGLKEAPLYATHTSAKIALEYSATHPLAPLLILDGLSIPETPSSKQFIDAYMRPFVMDADGAFLAREWTKIRDMIRWFPWFNKSVQTRMPLDVTPAWLQDYTVDMFSAGANYASAYSAAMRYTALPALRRVGVPTIVAAREDDVLYGHLERVPLEENDNLSTCPLPADIDTWLAWLKSQFKSACVSTKPYEPVKSAISGNGTYVDGPDGQILVHRRGPTSPRPLLILDAPTPMQAMNWAEMLPRDISVLVPELPGFGESDPLEQPTPEQFVESLCAVIDQLSGGSVDVLATGLSGPLAMKLAADLPGKVGRLILDGGCTPMAFPDGDALARLAPAFSFSRAGGHLHEIWHMLRDSNASWPWFDGRINAQRQLPPMLHEDQLYGAFLGILKQPASYGGSARASAEAITTVSLGAIRQPCLVFDHPKDGAYQGAAELAGHLPDARLQTRPSATADAVPAVLAFLNSTPCSAHPATQAT